VQLHPDFWMPPIKELHYLDRKQPSARAVTLSKRASGNLKEVNRRRKKRNLRPFDEQDIEFLEAYVRLPWQQVDLDAYAGLFDGHGDRITGDITPDYSILRVDTIARIVKRFPGTRVVFIARDPVERVWSHLTMHMRKGDIRPDASDSEMMRIARKRFVTRRTFQTEIVARWRQHVADSQFGFFLFDDLISDAEGLRARILLFLGADPDKRSGMAPAGYNRKNDPEKVPLSRELGYKLSRYLAEELEASAREFGGAAAGWPAKYGL
jgi:hypothetical protein